MSEEDQPSTPIQERPRGLLSEADRAYLRGETELSDSAERNARHRIRERIKSGLKDFELLWLCLSDRDLELVFSPEEDGDRQRIRGCSHHAIAFLWLGLWTGSDPYAGRVSDALEQATFSAGWVADAEVNISTEPAPEGALLLAKLKHKTQRVEDLRGRLKRGDIGESSEAELITELQRESSFLYYLFEKALIDEDVDAEKLIAAMSHGPDDELTVEDIQKERQGWASSPAVRSVMPVLTDISQGTPNWNEDEQTDSDGS
jgi:hypothetical protein